MQEGKIKTISGGAVNRDLTALEAGLDQLFLGVPQFQNLEPGIIGPIPHYRCGTKSPGLIKSDRTWYVFFPFILKSREKKITKTLNQTGNPTGTDRSGPVPDFRVGLAQPRNQTPLIWEQKQNKLDLLDGTEDLPNVVAEIRLYWGYILDNYEWAYADGD